jgi:hypothetical protein
MKIKLKLALLGTMVALTLPVAAQAQWWNQHPGYLHALSDIRTAYWLIAHEDASNPAMRGDEIQAGRELHAAYDEMAHAAVSDGRNIDDQPPPDFAWGTHNDRLHKALDLVHRAYAELDGEEENPQAAGLRQRAKGHLSDSSRLIGKAMRDSHF